MLNNNYRYLEMALRTIELPFYKKIYVKLFGKKIKEVDIQDVGYSFLLYKLDKKEYLFTHKKIKKKTSYIV